MGLHQCHHKLGVVPGTNTFRIKLSRVKCLEQTAVSFESCRGSARFEFIKSTHLFLLFFASGRSSSKNGILWSAIHFSLSGLLLQVGKYTVKAFWWYSFVCVSSMFTRQADEWMDYAWQWIGSFLLWRQSPLDRGVWIFFRSAVMNQKISRNCCNFVTLMRHK